MERIIHHDVVLHHAIKAFPKFDPPSQAEVVIDQIIRRAVVQVDIPPVIATPAVVAQDVGLDVVKLRQVLVFTERDRVQVNVLETPKAVAAPGVERAVIAGLEHGVEDIAKLDDMPAPATVTDVDTRAGCVVDRAMPHGDVHGHVDLHTRYLFLDPTDVVHQAIFDQAIGRVVGCFRPWRKIELGQ